MNKLLFHCTNKYKIRICCKIRLEIKFHIKFLSYKNCHKGNSFYQNKILKIITNFFLLQNFTKISFSKAFRSKELDLSALNFLIENSVDLFILNISQLIAKKKSFSVRIYTNINPEPDFK